MLKMFYGKSYKETEEPMPTHIRTAALAWQVAFLACAYLPGVVQPAKGALLLVVFWLGGVQLGALLYDKKHGGDSVAD